MRKLSLIEQRDMVIYMIPHIDVIPKGSSDPWGAHKPTFPTIQYIGIPCMTYALLCKVGLVVLQAPHGANIPVKKGYLTS